MDSKHGDSFFVNNNVFIKIEKVLKNWVFM